MMTMTATTSFHPTKDRPTPGSATAPEPSAPRGDWLVSEVAARGDWLVGEVAAKGDLLGSELAARGGWLVGEVAARGDWVASEVAAEYMSASPRLLRFPSPVDSV